MLQNLFRYRSTRRYYRTFSDTGVSVGTTELNQIQDRTYSDTGVPVGTTELDQRQDLFKYGTYQRQEYP